MLNAEVELETLSIKQFTEAIYQLATITCQSLPSAQSRRIYASHLAKFLKGCDGQLNRDSLQKYLLRAREDDAGPSTLRQALAAIRKLAIEAHERGLLPELDFQGILTIKVKGQQGVRSGNWLTLEQLKQLIALPDTSTMVGKRDAVVLGLLAGCALRRSEAAQLTWQSYQQRNGRSVLVDINGKGQKVRTVPVPGWANKALQSWQQALYSEDTISNRLNGPDLILRAGSEGKGGETTLHGAERGLSESGVWWIVKRYATQLHIQLAPHDLRRTCAQLMRKAGGQIEQIGFVLGHSSTRTTERYLGGSLELEPGKAAVDLINMED